MATMIEKVYLVHLNNGDKKPKIREVSEVFDRLHDNSDDEGSLISQSRRSRLR